MPVTNNGAPSYVHAGLGITRYWCGDVYEGQHLDDMRRGCGRPAHDAATMTRTARSTVRA
jgi:hypothetical protein